MALALRLALSVGVAPALSSGSYEAVRDAPSLDRFWKATRPRMEDVAEAPSEEAVADPLVAVSESPSSSSDIVRISPPAWLAPPDAVAEAVIEAIAEGARLVVTPPSSVSSPSSVSPEAAGLEAVTDAVAVFDACRVVLPSSSSVSVALVGNVVAAETEVNSSTDAEADMPGTVTTTVPLGEANPLS